MGPNLKFDISSAARDFEQPDMTDALATFIERHPHSVIWGSGSGKPENDGQYTQNFHEFTPVLARLALVDHRRGTDFVDRVDRKNFEEILDRAEAMPLTGGRKTAIADRLDALANDLDKAKKQQPVPADADPLLVALISGWRERALTLGLPSQLRKMAKTVRDAQEVPQPASIDAIRNDLSVNDANGAKVVLMFGRDSLRGQGAAELLTRDVQGLDEAILLARSAFLWDIGNHGGPDTANAVMPSRKDMKQISILRAKPVEPDSSSDQVGTAAGPRGRVQMLRKFSLALIL